MPKETGRGLYRKLQSDEDFKDIPVIVISGLAGKDPPVRVSVPMIEKPIDREALLKDLKRSCGSGGTVREDHLELQGDQRDGAVAWLERQGFRTRRSGG